jgi:hypothetical protein
MDDIGLAPFEAARIEVWIYKQLKEALSPEYIADELLKKWDAFQLLTEGKAVVARFCLLNNFSPSLFRVLKTDLRSGAPLPWPLVLELIYLGSAGGSPVISKEFADAILTGATRDKQLHGLASVALSHGEKDSRWKNILETEIKERLAVVKEERQRLFQEIQIFKTERMDAEVAQALTRILTLFPDDQEAKNLYEKLGEKEFEDKLDKLRTVYSKEHRFRQEEKLPQWPELEAAISKIQSTLDFEQTYLLSISLFQMDFFAKALDVLRTFKSKWNKREKLWEIEILLAQKSFAEALSCAQIALNDNKSDPLVVKASLYYSAKAYYGLGDSEQATSIIQGIIEHDPHFRDAAILLVEWKQ